MEDADALQQSLSALQSHLGVWFRWESVSDRFALNLKFWECVAFWTERGTYDERIRVSSGRNKLCPYLLVTLRMC